MSFVICQFFLVIFLAPCQHLSAQDKTYTSLLKYILSLDETVDNFQICHLSGDTIYLVSDSLVLNSPLEKSMCSTLVLNELGKGR
jgi:hypothetical protein